MTPDRPVAKRIQTSNVNAPNSSTTSQLNVHQQISVLNFQRTDEAVSGNERMSQPQFLTSLPSPLVVKNR